MGFGDFLFGGDPTIEQVSTLTQEQEQVMSALTQTILSDLGIPSLLPQARSTLEDILRGGDPAVAEQRFRELILPRQRRIFEEEIDPRISEAFVESGLRGTPRALARARGAQQFGEFAAGGLAEAIERGRQMSLAGLGLVPGITGLPVQQGINFTRTPAVALQQLPGDPGLIETVGGVADIVGNVRNIFSGFKNPFASVGSSNPETITV